MKLIINEDTDPVEEKYDDCHTCLHFTLFTFYIKWFLDCGEWFIYIGCNSFDIRFISAGHMFTWKR